MSVTRKAVMAAVAALALTGSMIASPAPADAHTYTKEGTVSAKEAGKLFKQTFKQRCLTVYEAQHIVHGSGVENWYDDDDLTLVFSGTRKSGHRLGRPLDRRQRLHGSRHRVQELTARPAGPSRIRRAGRARPQPLTAAASCANDVSSSSLLTSGNLIFFSSCLSVTDDQS